MTEDAAIYKNNVHALMRIMASLGLAADSLIGTAANALMYQTGKDMGRHEGKKLDRTDDLPTSLDMVMKAEEGAWQIQLRKDEGAKDHILQDDGSKKPHIIFRESPVRQVCLMYGTKMHGLVCHITHGLFAGMIGEVMSKKADLKVEHAGPNACKKIVELK